MRYVDLLTEDNFEDFLPEEFTIKGPMVKINTGGAAQPGQPASPVAPGDAIAAEPGSGPGKASKPAQSN